jgi:hypothetical protein
MTHAAPLQPASEAAPAAGAERIQTRPTLGPSGGHHEQEADRIAEEVLAERPAPLTGPLVVAPLVQRQVEDEEEEEEIQPKAAATPHPAPRGAALSEAAAAVATGGRPLSRAERDFFEPRFGRDFSAVRLHDGPRAGAAARGIGARAYTLGRNIAFAAGQHDAASREGRRLMAHELTHTLQQAAREPAFQREVADAGTEPAEAGTAAPSPPSRRCGPHVEDEIRKVWMKVQSRFRGWTLDRQRNACLYLITPFVPADPSAPAGRVTANRDAFDTLGLYQAGAEWQRQPPYHPPCGEPGSTSPGADAFDPAHEDAATCSNTVTVNGHCWLMGTVNYGTFGVMMKECNTTMSNTPGAWFGVRLEDFVRRGAEQTPEEGETEGNIREIARRAQPYMHWATLAAQIVGSPQLFSETALRTLVALYKIIDGDDPNPPLRWALATYNGGPGASPSGSNRRNCPTTCTLRYGCNPFDFVWEPVKPRRSWNAGCSASAAPPTWTRPRPGSSS